MIGLTVYAECACSMHAKQRCEESEYAKRSRKRWASQVHTHHLSSAGAVNTACTPVTYSLYGILTHERAYAHRTHAGEGMSSKGRARAMLKRCQRCAQSWWTDCARSDMRQRASKWSLTCSMEQPFSCEQHAHVVRSVACDLGATGCAMRRARVDIGAGEPGIGVLRMLRERGASARWWRPRGAARRGASDLSYDRREIVLHSSTSYYRIFFLPEIRERY